MSTVSLFFKQVMAQFKGDADTAIAAYNERKAHAAFKGQISALESKVIDDENAVADAQDALNEAMFPTSKIGDAKEYIRNVVYYKEQLDEAAEELESTNTSLAFFKALLVKEWEQVNSEE